MKISTAVLLLGFLWQQPPEHVTPDRRAFGYSRPLAAPAGGQHLCTVLDAAVYAHSKPQLADLRLLPAAGPGSPEIPYALTLSETASLDDRAQVLNQGIHAGHLVFDLAMPPRPYSDVGLGIDAINFLGTATVTGLQTQADARPVALGSFTLFDLTEQRLGRSTTLRLGESTFPFLHVDIAFSAAGAPAVPVTVSTVRGADVPASRVAQTLYTPVQTTATIVQRGRESIAAFELPAQVPVERIRFELAPTYGGNFSRNVAVRARVKQPETNLSDMVESVSGLISRVRLERAGREIREENLSFPATLGSDAQHPATVEVAIQNEDDQPLAIAAVILEMRERKVCFDAQPGPVAMFYGDPRLAAPIYDYTRTFDPAATFAPARLGPEQPQTRVVPPDAPKSLTERHPELLWLALLAVVSILGVIAFRSAKRI